MKGESESIGPRFESWWAHQRVCRLRQQPKIAAKGVAAQRNADSNESAGCHMAAEDLGRQHFGRKAKIARANWSAGIRLQLQPDAEDPRAWRLPRAAEGRERKALQRSETPEATSPQAAVRQPRIHAPGGCDSSRRSPATAFWPQGQNRESQHVRSRRKALQR